MKGAKRTYWHAGVLALLIFIGGTIPDKRLDDLADRHELFKILFSDRLVHVVAFGFFAWVLAFDLTPAESLKIPWRSILLLVLVYGFVLELWQAVLPYRTFALRDLYFDLIGGAIGLLAFLCFRRFTRKAG
jgi:hypothetical protein